MQVDPGTILIVDDDPLNRRLLAKSLETDGHRTSQFDNGFAALAALTGDDGAKSVVAAHRDSLVRIDVDDAGVLRDVDRPADLV